MKISIFTTIISTTIWQGSAIPLDLLQSLGKMKSTRPHQRKSNWERRATSEPGECRIPKEEGIDEDLLNSDTNTDRNIDTNAIAKIKIYVTNCHGTVSLGQAGGESYLSCHPRLSSRQIQI